MSEQDGTTQRHTRKWLTPLAGGTAVIALVALGLWSQRAPIAENFISRELGDLGVSARYDIADIGLRTQRIENIVLGDPDDPDLTARWVEIDLSLSGISPTVVAVRAGGVRMRGAIRGGVLNLGALDKFRDPTSKEPFGLPDIRLALDDARMRLETDAGIVGLKLDGSGNLRSGFSGKLAATMPQGQAGGCAVRDATAYVDVSVQDGKPRMAGPVRSDAIACPASGVAVAQAQVDVDMTLAEALDSWTGKAALVAQAVRAPGVVLGKSGGTVTFDGSEKGTQGQVNLTSAVVSASGIRAGSTQVQGRYALSGQQQDFNGTLDAHMVQLSDAATLQRHVASTRATPLGPLVAKLADALRRAGQDNSLKTAIAFAQRGDAGTLTISRAGFSSASGAKVALSDGGSLRFGWPAAPWVLDGSLTMGGGGFPDAVVRLARQGAGVRGQAEMQDYVAGKARLSARTIRFDSAANGETRFATVLRLDGPLDGGWVRGLSLPVAGVFGPGGGMRINSRCTPLGIEALNYGSFALGRTALTLCPADGRALLSAGPGGMRGGAVVRAPRLTGRLGDSALRLAADEFRYELGRDGFSGRNIDVSIGAESAPVKITLASLAGAMDSSGLSGRFDGGAGRIGTVPLLMSDAAGTWTFARGRLGINGGLMVADAEVEDRFQPMRSDDLNFTLENSAITARGTLKEPKSGLSVTSVDIVHDLNTARGRADLDVGNLVFNNQLQPDALTRMALGVVANVQGTVTGTGQIRWSGDTVTSDGVFRTKNMDLAAAFGPVKGLSSEIRFSDLLGLETPPGQEIRLASVNPGIEVSDGVIRFQLVPGQRASIEGGQWPFSGGQLLLLPTVMDFSSEKPRNMTFRVLGLDAGAFINTMELDNISATGTFDGLMPMVFDAQGGRIVGGVLVARQQGKPPLVVESAQTIINTCDPNLYSGSLSYVGEVSNAELGTFGKLAFDVLKNLRYKCLTILMDGAVDGEIVTQVVFNGVNQGQPGVKQAGMFKSFIGLPFIFNIRIEAPFRGLLNTAQSFVDPSMLIRRSLGDDYQAVIENRLAVQPAESDTVPSGEQK